MNKKAKEILELRIKNTDDGKIINRFVIGGEGRRYTFSDKERYFRDIEAGLIKINNQSNDIDHLH